MNCKLLSILTLVLALVTDASAQSRRVQFIEMLKQASPRYLYNQAKGNWQAGRFYSTDLQGPGPGGTHPTWQAALKASLKPVDMRANVGAAVMGRIHPFRFAGNLIDPLGVELQRQISSGEGIKVGRLVQALNPVTIGTTMVAGGVGDIMGAVAQSTLARFGPVGAGIGFFARPMLGFAGTIFGMNVGESMVNGKNFKEAIGGSLRAIKPGRDIGQLVGGTIGGTLGQVLIPIPIVGGIIGGMVGGTVGAIVGNSLSKWGPFKWMEDKMTGWLARMASKLEKKKPEAKPEPPPAPVPHSGADHAPPLGPVMASAPKPAVESAAPRPVPQTAFANPLDDRSAPSTSDLPLAAR